MTKAWKMSHPCRKAAAASANGQLGSPLTLRPQAASTYPFPVDGITSDTVSNKQTLDRLGAEDVASVDGSVGRCASSAIDEPLATVLLALESVRVEVDDLFKRFGGLGECISFLGGGRRSEPRARDQSL